MTKQTPPPWSRTLLYLFGAGLAASAVAWVVALSWALIRHGRLQWALVMDPMFLLTLVFLVPGAFFLAGSMFRRPPANGAVAAEYGWWDHLARVGPGWFFVVAGVMCMAELFVLDYVMR
jgi:hypothetical protein